MSLWVNNNFPFTKGDTGTLNTNKIIIFYLQVLDPCRRVMHFKQIWIIIFLLIIQKWHFLKMLKELWFSESPVIKNAFWFESRISACFQELDIFSLLEYFQSNLFWEHELFYPGALCCIFILRCLYYAFWRSDGRLQIYKQKVKCILHSCSNFTYPKIIIFHVICNQYSSFCWWYVKDKPY